MNFPSIVRDEKELEDLLSRPTPEVGRDLATLKGDLLVLGVAGKMGPTLARMAARALDGKRSVIGVARFSDSKHRDALEKAGVKTIACDLLEADQVRKLPDAGGVIFMAGQKFGSTGAEAATWATNAYLPGLVAERYRGVPTVVFSTGNVYPFVTVEGGGATEDTPTAPVGEYAQSALGRERVFEFFSRRDGTPMIVYRLNYAVELRYGILLDIARKVWAGVPVDVRMGHVNLIWQGDANATALRCLAAAQSPPLILNITGPETHSVRRLAMSFGSYLGKPSICEGREEPTALLSNPSKAVSRFGLPETPISMVQEWIAHWVKIGGPTLNKPTHFETRDGKF